MTETELIAGIYRIRNLKNGKCLYGRSIDLDRRRGEHFYTLGRGVHDNPHLQRAFDKGQALVFEIVVYLDTNESILTIFEQRFLDYWKGHSLCYNISPSADAPPKFEDLSPEIQERRRAANRKNGREVGLQNVKLKRGFHGLSKERRSEIGRRAGRRLVDLGLGVHGVSKDRRREFSRKAGRVCKELGVGIHGIANEQHSENSRKANHIRWHVNRKKPNPECALCQAEGLVDKT